MSTTSLSEEYINEIINQVASNLMLQKWSHDVQKLESIGQNYFGLIMPINLSGSSGTEDNKSSGIYQVVLKLAPTDERYRVSDAVTRMFRREIFVYSVLLRRYQEMQTEATMPRFYIPTLYLTRDEYCKEVIAMRDMREAGFKPYTHQTFLDLEHITIGLESLARLHALSFILKERDCKLYEKVTEVCVPLTETSNKRFIDIMINRLTKALPIFYGTEYQQLLENLKLNCGKLFDKTYMMAKGNCICHGDIWKENIMFNYEGSKPLQACIIDYQTTRISSPAFDTLYLIITSTDAQLRRENYFNLLDIYYKSFRQILEAFGLDADIVYSREFLDSDLKVVAPTCLITANTALWLSNGLQEEGHVRSKQVWSSPEKKAAAVETYKLVVKGIIDDFYSYGYLPGDML